MTYRLGVIEVSNIIYGVHDEANDKDFKLEVSWVCEESNRQYEKVSKELIEEAKTNSKEESIKKISATFKIQPTPKP